jgi:hypothetical protein
MTKKNLFRRIADARINCKIRGGLESVFKPTGRANARPTTGSVGPGSRQENAPKPKREGKKEKE